MEKKTQSVVAIGSILVIAVLLGGYFLLTNKRERSSVVGVSGNSVSVDGANVSIKAPGISVDVKGNGAEINQAESVSSEKSEIENKSNTVLVFDSSGSMAARIGGKSKLDIAKESVGTFVDKLDTKTDNLSVVVYGHKGSSSQVGKLVSCQGIEEIYSMGTVNASLVKSKIATFSANGWTPIADSLEKAKDILLASNFPGVANSVILISDGEETCGGDPIKKARELCQSDIKVVTNVIGFNVAGSEEAQLKAVAEAGCGNYYSVNSQQELDGAFVKIKGNTIDVNDGAGSSVHVDDNNVNVKAPDASVDVNDGNVEVDVPGANIEVDGDKVKVDVPGVEIDL